MNTKRKILASAGIAAVAIAALGAGLGWKAYADPSQIATTGVATRTVEIPKFEVDPTWPKIPNGWTFGEVSSATYDPQDGNIWIIQRPHDVRPGFKAAPPIMEFDQAGNYLRGWGGQDQGNCIWPTSEHGITVDNKGFIWITGNGDNDQVLKLTKDGKCVMQIGKARPQKSNQDTDQFWRPAGVFVYGKTNEVFISDGYGNKRVIVFDADTGAYKRMWGAFGNKPEDSPPRTPAAPMTPEQREAAELKRTMATGFDPKDPGPSQFSTVHDVKVSNDGMVYVSDRGGKRVQVFTTEGKYITQVWIDRWCLGAQGGCGNGQTAASVAFSPDADQKFMYVASRSAARVLILDRKSLQILGSFGSPGIAPGEFDVMHHMTTDSHGNIYTSEVEDGRRAQKFVFKGMQKVQIPVEK